MARPGTLTFYRKSREDEEECMPTKLGENSTKQRETNSCRIEVDSDEATVPCGQASSLDAEESCEPVEREGKKTRAPPLPGLLFAEADRQNRVTNYPAAYTGAYERGQACAAIVYLARGSFSSQLHEEGRRCCMYDATGNGDSREGVSYPWNVNATFVYATRW